MTSPIKLDELMEKTARPGNGEAFTVQMVNKHFWESIHSELGLESTNGDETLLKSLTPLVKIQD